MLKTIEWYTLNEWTIWHVNYSSIKLFFKTALASQAQKLWNSLERKKRQEKWWLLRQMVLTVEGESRMVPERGERHVLWTVNRTVWSSKPDPGSQDYRALITSCWGNFFPIIFCALRFPSWHRAGPVCPFLI